MDTSIVVCVVTCLFGFLGTIVTVVSSNSKIQQELKTHNEIQDAKISTISDAVRELQDEVRENNNIKIRLSVAETKLANLEQKLGGQ